MGEFLDIVGDDRAPRILEGVAAVLRLPNKRRKDFVVGSELCRRCELPIWVAVDFGPYRFLCVRDLVDAPRPEHIPADPTGQNLWRFRDGEWVLPRHDRLDRDWTFVSLWTDGPTTGAITAACRCGERNIDVAQITGALPVHITRKMM